MEENSKVLWSDVTLSEKNENWECSSAFYEIKATADQLCFWFLWSSKEPPCTPPPIKPHSNIYTHAHSHTQWRHDQSTDHRYQRFSFPQMKQKRKLLVPRVENSCLRSNVWSSFAFTAPSVSSRTVSVEQCVHSHYSEKWNLFSSLSSIAHTEDIFLKSSVKNRRMKDKRIKSRRGRLGPD